MKKILVFSANVFATPVNINTADAQIIANSLKGIGEKKAQVIIAYREKNGDFKTIESLTEVAGIGEKTVEKNKEDILLTDTIETIEKEVKKEIKKEVKKEVKKPEVKQKK